MSFSASRRLSVMPQHLIDHVHSWWFFVALASMTARWCVPTFLAPWKRPKYLCFRTTKFCSILSGNIYVHIYEWNMDVLAIL